MSQFVIQANTLTLEEMKKLAVALHHIGLTGQLQVGVEGPDHFKATTPKLTAEQFIFVTQEISLTITKPSNGKPTWMQQAAS